MSLSPPAAARAECARRCAVEYNCARWGIQDLPAQAGLGAYERGADGLLAAARAHNDVEPPPELSGCDRLSQ